MPKAEVPHKDELGGWKMMHEQTDVDKQKVKSASLSMSAPSLLFGLPEWLQLVLGGLLTGVLFHSNSITIFLRKSLTETLNRASASLRVKSEARVRLFPQGHYTPVM